jgi:hypothetical protein
MRSTYFSSVAFAPSMLHSVIAQDVIPTDLSAGFSGQVQVSFNGEANEGFKSGTSFSKAGETAFSAKLPLVRSDTKQR